MNVTSAKIIHTDNMGREVQGRGYPLLKLQTDIGELVIGMDQMPISRGYDVAMIINEVRSLDPIEIGPDDDVDRPLQHPLTLENATFDPTVVALTREFLDRVDRGATPAVLDIPSDA